MNTIMIFGTFDLLHEGHKFFIREAKELGKQLIVIIARDKTVAKLKGAYPHENEDIRKEKVEELGFADRVILGHKKDHLDAVSKYQPEIILLGYDQKHFTETLKEDLKRLGLGKTKVIRASAHEPDKYKTSIIKNRK